MLNICNLYLPLQIGTWSRWLEDQFEQKEDKSDSYNKKSDCENFRLFHLLNSLGDLMMLPFKMLADKSTRREVTRLVDHRYIRNNTQVMMSWMTWIHPLTL